MAVRAPRIVASFTHPAHLYAFTRFTQVATLDVETGKFKRPKEEYQRWTPGAVHVVDQDGKLGLEWTAATRREAEPVRDRWISVFSNCADKGRLQWWAELYVDRDGRIAVNPALHKHERRPWDPQNAPRSTLQHELPHIVHGRKLAYCFIGTPYQLTNACIDKLESDNRLLHCVPCVDLTDTAHIVDRHSWQEGTKIPSELIAIPVLLPFDVARRLAQDIECLISARLNEHGFDGSIAAASPQQRELAQGYQFAKILESIANNPDMKHAARGFGDHGREKLQNFIDEREKSIRKLDMAIEAVAADLASWLERVLLDVLMNGAYAEDEHKVLVALDEATAPLTQTAGGLYALDRLLTRAPEGELLHRYFAPNISLGATERGCASRVGANYVSLLQTIYTVRLSRHTIDVTSTLHSLTNALGDIIAWDGKSLEVRDLAIRQFAIMGEVSPEQPPKNSFLVRAKTLVAEGDALKKLNAFAGRVDAGVKFFDSINLLLAWRAFMDTPEGQDALREKRGLELLSGGATLFAGVVDKIFNTAGRGSVPVAARVLVKGVGVIGAALSLWTSAMDMYEAKTAGDDDAYWALMLSTTASLAGPIVGAVGAALGLTVGVVLGWVLAAAGLIGYFWYLHVKNSELETLIENSAFGHREWTEYAIADDKKRDRLPSWLPVPLHALRNTWRDQLTALVSLVQQFEVQIGTQVVLRGNITPFRNVRIYTGQIDHATKFLITWKWDAALRSSKLEEVWSSDDRNEEESRRHRSYVDRLRYDSDGNLYFEAPLPAQAIHDTGYIDGGSYGFRLLTAAIVKEAGQQRIPLTDAVQIIVHRNHLPQSEARMRSVDA